MKTIHSCTCPDAIDRVRCQSLLTAYMQAIHDINIMTYHNTALGGKTQDRHEPTTRVHASCLRSELLSAKSLPKMPSVTKTRTLFGIPLRRRWMPTYFLRCFDGEIRDLLRARIFDELMSEKNKNQPRSRSPINKRQQSSLSLLLFSFFSNPSIIRPWTSSRLQATHSLSKTHIHLNSLHTLFPFTLPLN